MGISKSAKDVISALSAKVHHALVSCISSSYITRYHYYHRVIKVDGSIIGAEHSIETRVAWIGIIRMGMVLVVYAPTVGEVVTLCGFGNEFVHAVDSMWSL